MKHTCIYCKQTKDESEFNREHVVPRMMGRYTDGLVLSKCQVCQECNSYFSKELEDKIGLNSYEAFLRMKSGTKKMSNGRQIKGTRISLTGSNDIFKGLSFIPIADDTTPEGFRFDIDPCVGFKLSDDGYQYYKLEDIPVASTDVMNQLRKQESPIIQFGYEESEVGEVLREKGYLTESAKYTEKCITDEYKASEFMTNIKFSVDSIVRRVCAKTVFNYLCWCNSPEYMLEPRFDMIRDYIRYGIWNENLWFRNSIGFVSAVTPPNDTAHAIGTLLNLSSNGAELLGCVTWFGEITYILKICNIQPDKEHGLNNGMTAVVLPQIETKFTYFDNETTQISSEDAIFIYGQR